MFNNIRKKVLLVGRDLPYYSGYTYHFQIRATIFGGIAGGIFSLQSIILRKSLGAEPELLAILASISAVPYLLSPFWARYMQQHSPRAAITFAAVAGYAAILFIALTDSPIYFIFALAMPAFADAVYLPVRNQLFESNYSSRIRGKAFGYASAYGVVITMVVTQGVGFIMGVNENAFRYLFPVGGVMGFLSLFLMARIKPRRTRRAAVRPEKEQKITSVIRDTVRDVVKILKENPGFRKFQRNFFLYGFAILMTQPVAVVFLVDQDQLGASYPTAAAAMAVLPLILEIICMPIWGHMLDRLRAMRTSGLVFSLLALWGVLLFAAAMEKSLLLFFVAYAVAGVALSGVHIVWNLGSMEFAGRRKPDEAAVPGDAGKFMSVHAMMVGVRGLIAPTVGVISYYIVGAGWTFLIAGGLFLLAFLLMFSLASKMGKMKTAEAPAPNRAEPPR